ncbi:MULTISPECIES: hypothetical protein [unclassified Pseudomonas]|uniref:hypothetical protein n=1 Tax=unclassified Pseudomonas TaxID=196821 RepID=UPI00244D0994|nr:MULTISPECIES: hypothetical protein [unclassified Pseudomonas]MDH0892846.1 hypothetical protein [Pseudomonas sp. GD03875]MDH1064680.1 hypothetical protein [Pseudomonas sp. GD03985]
MRIDGFSSSYPLDRSARPGSSVTPLREAQREVEQRQEQPVSPSSTQGYEQLAQPRRVQASNASSDSLPARFQESLSQQRGFSAKANQALAAYGNTAGYTEERDASEVLGLDLYA